MRIRRRVMTLAGCLLALAAVSGVPAARAQTEATDYKVLPVPQPTESPGKIEVIEFFSYGCPHCAEFFPLLSSWLGSLPKDVVLRRVPVGFNRPAWVNLQRAYFALQASGDLAKLDGALFHAIHQEQLPLFEEQALEEWVGKSGGHADKFASAYASFGVNSLTVQADKMTEDYQVTSIPTMVVNGKYVAQGNTFSELIASTDKLIAKARAERAPAAAPKNAAPRK